MWNLPPGRAVGEERSEIDLVRETARYEQILERFKTLPRVTAGRGGGDAVASDDAEGVEVGPTEEGARVEERLRRFGWMLQWRIAAAVDRAGVEPGLECWGTAAVVVGGWEGRLNGRVVWKPSNRVNQRGVGGAPVGSETTREVHGGGE